MGGAERTGTLFTTEDGLVRPKLLVFACALGLSLSVGPVFVSTFSTFIRPLHNEFGWSRAALSLFFSVQGLSLIAATFVLGRIVERFGSRRVIATSAILLGAAMFGLALSPPNYWLLMFWCGLIGATGAGTNTFAYLSVLPQWFTTRLGLIFGLAMTGVGFGQLAMPVLAQRMTALLGWRGSYEVLASLVLCISVPVAIFLLKENPRFSLAGRAAEMKPVPGHTLGQALRTPTFWLYWASFFLLAMVLGATTVHLAPLLMDRGVSAATAASLAGLSGMSVLIFRLGGGYLIDRVGPVATASLAFAAAGVAQLCVLPRMGTHLVAATPLLIGLGTGIEGDVLPYLCRRHFGMKAYSLIYNRMFLSMMSGPILGAWAAGLLFDRSGQYTLGLWCSVAIAVASILLFWLASFVGSRSPAPADPSVIVRVRGFDS